MANNRTPKGIVAIRTHDRDVTKVTYAPAPAKGSGKHYNPRKCSGCGSKPTGK